jgi:hypothetical protein
VLLDVTHAYKSLLAEKQALEITVKALKTKTLTQSLKPTNDASGGATSLSSSLSDVSSEMDSQFDSTAVKKVDEEASQEEKIAALTSNVQILLENKSKLEASYQAERKKFRVSYIRKNNPNPPPATIMRHHLSLFYFTLLVGLRRVKIET